ncbi:hypothetical protein OROGR_027535 [Orobanche gracilis]
MTDFNRCALLLLLLAASLDLFSSHTAYCDSGGDTDVQWQILTELNYSSQIRVHPHLLLLVTVPWSGESRSLMKGLADAVSSDACTLKLMVLYKNVDMVLADALGATDGITVFYYHNSLSHKYRGRLRVQNILVSVHYVMSLSADEQPLKSIVTAEELGEFLHSTDKAVLLFDFCGWTPRLVAKNKSTTRSDLMEGHLSFVGANSKMENNGTVVGEEKDNRKFMKDNKLSCARDDGFTGTSWLNQFSTVNNSLVKEVENATFSAGKSCSLFELQQYELFFQKFIEVARDFFLPPEKYRFAVVRERSLLPLLNLEEPISGSVIVHFAGCPSCSQVLKEVDILRTILQSQPSPVSEIEDDPHGVHAALPATWPSMLLFVDRSSNSMEMRRESQEALQAFRELAKHTQMPNHVHGQAIKRVDKTLDTHKHPRLQHFASSENNVLQDKMSVMIMNEGQQVTLENLVSDLRVMSVHDILTYALKKKERKLSSFAKDVGFQLLSKDFDIEAVESQPSHSEDQSNPVTGRMPVESGPESADIDNQISADGSDNRPNVVPDFSDVEHIMLEDKEDDRKILSTAESEQSDDPSITSNSAQGWNIEETAHSGVEEIEQQTGFTVSFFFFDGLYRLLETLTGGLKVPSVVIVDPMSEKHYVLNELSPLSYTSLSLFIDDFLAGKLHPYLQSSSVVPSLKSAQRPPFVNQGFHETDSVPVVTTHTFSELVFGNKSDPRNFSSPWDRNVLVLFSNSWCGFSQRMEFVVREVYRAVKGYAYMKTNSSRKDKSVVMAGTKSRCDQYCRCDLQDSTYTYASAFTCWYCANPVYLGALLLWDVNMGPNPDYWRRDVYPLLLLFPAERKNETVSYEGNTIVSDIIKFLAAHGSHIMDLIINQDDPNSVEEEPQTRSLHHEVLIKDVVPTVAVKYKINAQLPLNLQEKPQLSVGVVLTATEKLLDVHPFEESKILIVKVDERSGFRGLIFNKHISWDSLEDLGEGSFEFLKEAPLSFGGPVMMRGWPLAALTYKFIEGQSLEILPNIYLMDQLVTPSLVEDIRAGNQSVGDFWFFMGYSSWGWEQLFTEIAQGAWNVSKGDMENLNWPWR